MKGKKYIFLLLALFLFTQETLLFVAHPIIAVAVEDYIIWLYMYWQCVPM